MDRRQRDRQCKRLLLLQFLQGRRKHSAQLDLLEEALDEFGQNNINVIEKGAEWADVTIRCYLLGLAISEVLNDLEEDFDEAHKEMEA